MLKLFSPLNGGQNHGFAEVFRFLELEAVFVARELA